MKKQNRLFTIVLFVCAILCTGEITLAQSSASTQSINLPPSSIDVPRTISYQGLVRGVDGKPLADGSHSFTISLYSDEAGINMIWSDAFIITTEQGIFNILLGSGQTPLPSSKE